MSDGLLPGAGQQPEPERAALVEQLRCYGRRLDVPQVDGMTVAEQVLARIIAEQVPVPFARPASRAARLRGWARRHARALSGILAGLLLILGLAPLVRAAVVDWFDFSALEVRYEPQAPPGPGVPGDFSTGPPAPPYDSPLPLTHAGGLAGFAPAMPAVLGSPAQVSLSADHRASPGSGT